MARARFDSREPLESFGEFFSERAGRTLRTTLLRTLVLLAASLAARRCCGGAIHLTSRPSRPRPFRSWRLRLIRPQQPIFERRAVKAANNRLHLVRRRRFYKSEAFRLLRFVVAYHFDRICDKIFRRQPSLDIVGGDPYW